MLTYVIRATLRAWRLRREGKRFDLVHTYFCIPTGPAGWAAAKIFKVANVLTLIGGDLLEQPLEQREYQNPVLRFIIRRLILAADLVTAISRDTRSAALKFMSGLRKEIHVVTLGFEPPETVSPEAPDIPKLRDHVALISVSRLVPRKGFDLLFRTLAGIDESWTLQIVGDGPEENSLKRLAEELDIADRLVWSGYLSEARKFEQLREADLFILFSHHEGLGLVYFEAMFCGLPILTSRQGGQTDFLSEPDNALLISTSDPVAQLTETARRAFVDTAWRRAAGRANREKIQTLFTSKIVTEYDRLFQLAAKAEVPVV